MKKGLRQSPGLCLECLITLKPCPDEEGIKTVARINTASGSTLKPCPDEEGIKTIDRLGDSGKISALKPCPDEEGIKTGFQFGY